LIFKVHVPLSQHQKIFDPRYGAKASLLGTGDSNQFIMANNFCAVTVKVCLSKNTGIDQCEQNR